MCHGASKQLQKLDNRDLLSNLQKLLHEDHQLEVELVEHIGEVERRGLYRQYAYSSMHQFCVGELHISNSVAYKRIGVSRAARRFPLLLEAIRERKLHLTAASLIAPKLTADNQEELIAAATHQSKRQVEKLLAEMFPQPDVPETIRKLPTPALLTGEAQGESLVRAELARARANLAARRSLEVQKQHDVAGHGHGETAPSRPRDSEARRGFVPAPTVPPVVEPLSPARYKIQLTASQQLVDKIAQAKALLGPRVGHNELEVVLERAVDALIAELENKKHGVTSKPRSTSTSKPSNGKRSRHIPRAVKRDVYARDEGKCAFVSADGRRCNESLGLEYHHLHPFALGGESTVANLELRCRAHNALAAEEDFGRAKMLQYAKRDYQQAPRVREAPATYRLDSSSVGSGSNNFPSVTGGTALALVDAAARRERVRARSRAASSARAAPPSLADWTLSHPMPRIDYRALKLALLEADVPQCPPLRSAGASS